MRVGMVENLMARGRHGPSQFRMGHDVLANVRKGHPNLLLRQKCEKVLRRPFIRTVIENQRNTRMRCRLSESAGSQNDTEKKELGTAW